MLGAAMRFKQKEMSLPLIQAHARLGQKCGNTRAPLTGSQLTGKQSTDFSAFRLCCCFHQQTEMPPRNAGCMAEIGILSPVLSRRILT